MIKDNLLKTEKTCKGSAATGGHLVFFIPGLGRVLDKSTRVQVQVLEKMSSTTTSTGFSKVLEYKYKYFKKYLRTSTEYFVF